jgi:MerR family transcriptional regulator, copper efflux regulator
MPKKFLTVREVSRLLGVTPLTIRNWDAKGKLVAHRHPMNNYRVYKIEDIELLMKNIEESKGMTIQPVNAKHLIKKPRADKPKARKLEIDVL